MFFIHIYENVDSINIVKPRPSQAHFLLWVGIALCVPHNGDIFY